VRRTPEFRKVEVSTIVRPEKFLNLWEEVDPDITEVDDAKKRLAGLKSQ